MDRQAAFTLMVACIFLFCLAGGLSGAEKLDRGLIAVESEDGSVFLSWRLLKDDSQDIAFQVTRRGAGPSRRESGTRPGLSMILMVTAKRKSIARLARATRGTKRDWFRPAPNTWSRLMV